MSTLQPERPVLGPSGLPELAHPARALTCGMLSPSIATLALCLLPLPLPARTQDEPSPPVEAEVRVGSAGSEGELEAQAENGPERPNVLLILADDLGWGDIGAYGCGSRIPTPNLDALAAGGLRLTDAHSPSAVCTPTRYGLLTGRYAWRTRLKQGVLIGDSPNLIDPERTTLPDLLQDAGYRTGGFGKWHLGLGWESSCDFSEPIDPAPIDHGFEHYFGIPASLDFEPYVYLLGRQAVQPPTETTPSSGHRRGGGGGFWRSGGIAPDFRHHEVLPRLGERSAEWIERVHRETPEQPFFCYLALSSPHTPWLPGPAFQGRTEVGHYGDFVAHTDAVVGEVLQRIELLGLASDTLVIFTSDNGSHWPAADVERYQHAANGPWRGQKADIHEGGHRVPFIASWPDRLPAGVERDGLLILTDVMGTLAGLLELELADDQAPDSIDQWAWLSHAQGATASAPRTNGVLHALDGLFAYREGPWKLIEGRGSGGFTPPQRIRKKDVVGPEGQLYHLGRDPGEQHNLWEAEPQRVEDMLQRLRAIRAR